MDFVEFPKIARYSREMVITEKLDGTNASVTITEMGEFFTGSRTQWITPQNDNHGFSLWAHNHKNELMSLGPGTHFGEWWGCGIQRKYGLQEKRWSLFNVGRWTAENKPECCHLVPVIYRGIFENQPIEAALQSLRINGSVAAPGFMKPEGVVIYHTAANICFKKTLEKDEEWKGKQ
jgi:hypothetical protein